MKCSDNIKLWFPVRTFVLSILFNICEIALCDSNSLIHLYFLVKGTKCSPAEVWPLQGHNNYSSPTSKESVKQVVNMWENT